MEIEQEYEWGPGTGLASGQALGHVDNHVIDTKSRAEERRVFSTWNAVEPEEQAMSEWQFNFPQSRSCLW